MVEYTHKYFYNFNIKEKYSLEITRYTFNADVKQTLTFAFVSDLHDSDNEPILKELVNIAPNAVLVGGDFVHDTELYEKGIDFLKLCAEKFPTFCSLGNHEMKCDRDIVSMVKESGAVLLDNCSARFEGVNIGGLTSGYGKMSKQGHFDKSPEPDLAFLESFSRLDGMKILLSHHPEYYPRYIKDKNIDLTLSGHAHGGQWRFFGRGVFAPNQGIFPKYTSGIHDGKFIVSRGLGNKTRIPRINNKEEILVITVFPNNDKNKK